ncbi:superoxide dismutase family protein [Halomonas salipaludis]|nr:superoxide dismutase family protein [Halomonas salipaludis]
MKKGHAVLIGLTLGAFSLTSMAEEGNGPTASVEFVDNHGEVVGEGTIDQGPAGVVLNFSIDGLDEGWKAIHIHGVGTCEDHEEGFQASGGHLNPDDSEHGFLNPDGPDAGDLPNFYVHSDGSAMVEMFNERASLDGSVGGNMLDDDGSALVIHENPDDHMSQPIGGAGARVACGVVQGG